MALTPRVDADGPGPVHGSIMSFHFGPCEYLGLEADGRGLRAHMTQPGTVAAIMTCVCSRR